MFAGLGCFERMKLKLGIQNELEEAPNI